MKRSVGNWLWSLVSVLMIASLALAACGPSGSQAPTQPPASPQVVEKVVTQIVEKPVEKVVEKTVEVQVTVAAPTPDATAAATGGTGATAGAADEFTLNPDVSGNVELWHFWASPVRRNAIRRVIAMCQQKLPNIKVTDTVKPFGDIWTANLAAVAAGSGMPDVIVSDRPTLPKDAADGVYQSLQEWADRDNVKREQFYDWAWDQGVYENQTYGIPHETDVNVLFYNKNLFQQAGLDPNTPPKTWAEVEEYANKLDVIENGEIKRVGFFPLWNRGTDLWQYVNDANMIAEDGTPQINNPKMVEAVEWMKKWVDRYGGWEKLQSFRNQFGAPPNDIFMSSGVAMYVDIFGYNSALQFYRPTVTLDNGENPRMDWGIAPLPYNTKPGNSSGGFALSIPTGAANPEAAWEFIKCATGAEGQSSWARDTQAQPTNLKAATDPVLLADPAWQVVDESLKTSTGGVYVAKYPNWSEQLTQRWEQVWLGNKTPKQALDEAQAAVEDALQ